VNATKTHRRTRACSVRPLPFGLGFVPGTRLISSRRLKVTMKLDTSRKQRSDGRLSLVRLPGLRMIMLPVPCQDACCPQAHARMQATFPRPSIREAALSHSPHEVILPYCSGRIYISPIVDFGHALSNKHCGHHPIQMNGIPNALAEASRSSLAPCFSHAALSRLVRPKLAGQGC
jgi:hypothetical protein